ncbi:MAG: leucine-rich repeat protein [Bacilli bacterium]
MKKVTLFFTFFISIFFLLTMLTACGGRYSKSTNPHDYLEFELLDDDTYAVTGFSGLYVKDILIPAYHNNKQVSTIKSEAFKMNHGIWGADVNLPIESLTIEEGLKIIEDQAFFESGLLNVNIADSVEYIGQEAFYDNEAVINLPENIKFIGIGAYQSTKLSGNIVLEDVEVSDSSFASTDISSVTFLNNFTTIPDYLFYDCLQLTNVTLPLQLTEIGRNCFFGCTSLTSINFPETLEIINSQAFENSGLTKIDFTSNMKEIGDNAFSNCINLLEINFPNQNIVFGRNAFFNCSNLNNVFFGTNLLVNAEAFIGCPLKNMTVSNESIYNVIEGSLVVNENNQNHLILSNADITDFQVFYKIGEYSCAGRTFDNLIIGNHVDTISEFAFFNAKINQANIAAKVVLTKTFNYASINKLTISSKEISTGAFDNVDCLLEIVFGEGCETIKASAFANCFDLETIYLSSTIKSVETGAFIQCHNLVHVYYDLRQGEIVRLFSGNFIIYISNILNEQQKIDVKLNEDLSIYVYEEIYDQCISRWGDMPIDNKYVFHDNLVDHIKIRK